MNHSSDLSEVETKILDVNRAELLPRIFELGFKYLFEKTLKAQWLVNPHNGQKLRVRDEEGILMIEHKKPSASVESNGQLKSMKETGFEARGFNDAIATLTEIGLDRIGLPSVKRRISYVLNADTPAWVRLDFDTYSQLGGKSIPEFMEIESTDGERVYHMAETLGFQRSDCRDYGPKQLFGHYFP